MTDKNYNLHVVCEQCGDTFFTHFPGEVKMCHRCTYGGLLDPEMENNPDWLEDLETETERELYHLAFLGIFAVLIIGALGGIIWVCLTPVQ